MASEARADGVGVATNGEAEISASVGLEAKSPVVYDT